MFNHNNSKIYKSPHPVFTQKIPTLAFTITSNHSPTKAKNELISQGSTHEAANRFQLPLIRLAQNSRIDVEVAITCLELRFEADAKIDQVDDLPIVELPALIDLARMPDSNNQVAGIVENFIGRPLWLEVKSPEVLVSLPAL